MSCSLAYLPAYLLACLLTYKKGALYTADKDTCIARAVFYLILILVLVLVRVRVLVQLAS